MALLYGYRSITIFVTLLPKSNPSYFCTPKLDPSQISVALILRRVAFMLSGFGLTINGHQVYCGDFMYSGHTMIMVLTNLIVNECKPCCRGSLRGAKGARASPQYFEQ